MQKVFIFSLLLLAACGTKETPETIFKESMAIHDEVMVKMDKVYQLKVSLTEWADTLASDSTLDNTKKLAEVQVAIDSLAQAEKMMMDWMHQTVSPPSAKEGHEGHQMHGGKTSDDVTVHNHQKANILKVKALFERVIPYAEGVLGKK